MWDITHIVYLVWCSLAVLDGFVQLRYNIRMHLNWVDFIIIFVILYEMYHGWKAGFITLGISLVSFAISLWIAVLLKMPVSGFFTEKFGIAEIWSSSIAYIGISLAVQMVLSHVLALGVARLPKTLAKSKLNGALGAFVSVINTLTIIAFALVLVLALPLKGTVRDDIRASEIGGAVISIVEKHGGPIKMTFDTVSKSAVSFLTVSPGSKESMPLDIAPAEKDLEINDDSERRMLALVNKERVAAGAPALTVDVRLVTVARGHSKDMYLRKYFSHFSPEGKNLGDRLKTADIGYSLAGENLAFAPDVEMAHQGLMNSPDHKKNLLDPQFRHVGIGIISTRKYGMMVTEVFLN